MPQRTLEQWLADIEANHPQEIDLGLERVRAVGLHLGLTDLAVPVITVAGTNGKGTTVAYLSAILSAAGYRVGAYTSPHFIDYNERVMVAGKQASDQQFCDAFTAIEQACQQLSISLSYFEYGTLAACWIFNDLISRQALDIVVLEVGLGGRLDAVNIVEPSISVVTTVAIDHQSWLGSTREEIGVEKAGIFRSGKPAIYGERDIPGSVENKIEQLGATPYRLGKEFSTKRSEASWCWLGKIFSGISVELTDLPIPALPFDNAGTAIQALQLLNLPIDIEHYRQGISQACLTGRFQRFTYRGKSILVDVAHNPHAATHLSQQLTNESYQQLRAVVGMLADKDVKGTLAPLSDQVTNWYAGTIHQPRGLSADELKSYTDAVGLKSEVEAFDSVTHAFEQAVTEATDADLILVFGSFFTVADVLSLVRENDN